MHFKRIMTLLLAGVIAAYPGGIVSEAADIKLEQNHKNDTVSYEEVMNAVNAFYEENGRDLRGSEELKTMPAEFSFGHITTEESAMHPIKAVKLSDVQKVSMAQDAIQSGTITKQEGKYILKLKVKPIKKMNIEANLTGLEVYYYNSMDAKTLSISQANVANNSEVEVEIPVGACGLTTGESVYDNGVLLNNMIKVRMTTDIKDKWFGGLVPEKMKNPTCFITFNVE